MSNCLVCLEPLLENQPVINANRVEMHLKCFIWARHTKRKSRPTGPTCDEVQNWVDELVMAMDELDISIFQVSIHPEGVAAAFVEVEEARAKLITHLKDCEVCHYDAVSDVAPH